MAKGYGKRGDLRQDYAAAMIGELEKSA